MESKPSAGALAASDIAALLRARNPLIWITTKEEVRAERLLLSAAEKARYEPLFWDCATGITKYDGSPVQPSYTDPGQVLQYIRQSSTRQLYVLRDFPAWLRDPTINRGLRSLVRNLSLTPRDEARSVIVLTPSSEIPPELQGHAVVVDWPLPDRAEIAEILDAAIAGLPDDIRESAAPNGTRDAAIDAAVGLTAEEAQACYAKSLVSTRRIDPTAVASEKKRVIAREKVLEWFDPLADGLSAVGGLEELKAWLVSRRAAFGPKARAYGLPAPKGALLVGVPGCLHGDTPIYDPKDKTTKTIRQRHTEAKPFHVWAMGPAGPVITVAMPPVRYSESMMLTFTTDAGDSITVTPRHRFWDGNYWIYADAVYDKLRAGELFRLPTTSDSALKALTANALRSLETTQDFQGDCPAYLHSDDEQPRTREVSAQAILRQRAYVPERSHVRRSGGLGVESLHSRFYPTSYHLSKPNYLPLRFALADNAHRGISPQVPSIPPELLTGMNQSSPQLRTDPSQQDTGRQPAVFSRASIFGEVSCCRYTRVRMARQSRAEYYDFHVPGYENYWACGLWHHNCGKSLTAKAVASAWGMPLLRLDMGALRSKWVGDSEANIRKALRVAETVAPCVLWLDEIEKAMAGATQGAADGGVSADALGTVLSWMQDRAGSVFVIATANDVSALPPELMRKGRFDELFFVDLPTKEERAHILAVTLGQYKRSLPMEQIYACAEAAEGFTGAELAAVIPDAMFGAFADSERDLDAEDVIQSIRRTVPLSATAAEKIKTLRDWAKGRARPASTVQVVTEGKRELDL